MSASLSAAPATLEHGSSQWLRQARTARRLSWLSLAYMAAEGAVAATAAVVAGSVALLGFGLDSVVEALASIIVVWRFTGTRTLSLTAERRVQKAVAVTYFLLAPYIDGQTRYERLRQKTQADARPCSRSLSAAH